MAISAKTATDIALAYREIERGENLLADVEKALARIQQEDIRDVFGRRVDGLQLGVPSGATSHSLFNVPWVLARPIIRAHIEAQRAQIMALQEVAKLEMENGQ